MKKNIFNIFLIFTILLSFIFISCGDDSDDEKKEETTPDTEQKDEIEPQPDEAEVPDETSGEDKFACYNMDCSEAADCTGCGEDVTLDCPPAGPLAGKCQVVDCDPEVTESCPEGKTCTDVSEMVPEGTPYTHLCM